MFVRVRIKFEPVEITLLIFVKDMAMAPPAATYLQFINAKDSFPPDGSNFWLSFDIYFLILTGTATINSKT